MAGLGRVNVKTVIRKFSSALYITGDKAQTNFVVLTPFIDFEEQLKHKAELIKSIEARKLHLNLDKIEKRWNFFKMLDDHRDVLEVTRNEIYNVINRLKNEDAEKNKDDIEKLDFHVKLVKNDLKNIREFAYGVEENANLGVLSLPNFLHPKTPLDDEVILHEFLTKPEIVDKSHMEIGKIQHLIEYTDSMFYFLKSKASIFEFALINYFQEKLLEAGLIQFSNADFARSVVIEGCGIDHLDKGKVFTLDGSSNDLNRLHLVGGGSLHSFMAYFTKHTIQSSILPLKFFSLGRNYTPVTENSDLLNLSQNSVAEIFVAVEDDTQKMDEILNGLTQEIIKIYEPLGYHFKLVYAPANDLEKGESLKVSIQMFSNYSRNYIEVGFLSVYDNYLSKRLLFIYNVKKERKFVKVISGQVLNVQKFLACALENNFICKKSLLTDTLQEHV